MTTRTYALTFGLIFIIVGLAGFVPQVLQTPQGGELAPDNDHQELFGMFAVNWLHNIVHLGFGLWGLGASRSAVRALQYARGVAIIYAVLTVSGFIPGLMDLFGLVPLHGNNIWLHAALAAIAAYFGWVHRDPVAP